MAKRLGYLCIQGYPNRICSGCTSGCCEPVYRRTLSEEAVEPATPFWQGYERSPDTVNEIVEALRAALYASPTERVGQLLSNVFGDDLRHLWDEDLVTRLRERLPGG